MLRVSDRSRLIGTTLLFSAIIGSIYVQRLVHDIQIGETVT